MGLPVHFIDQQYAETWPEVLRTALEGHAVVEWVESREEEVSPLIEGPCRISTYYIIGKYGYFTLYGYGSLQGEDCYAIFAMFPFCCNEERNGNGMVLLEERIHRAFDPIRLPYQGEETILEERLPRQEMELLKQLGWDRGDPRDFRNRKAVELTDAEPAPEEEPELQLKIRSRLIACPFGSECREEYVKTWPQLLQERLEGIASVKVISEEPRRFYSPDRTFYVETPTTVEIDDQQEIIHLTGQNENGFYAIISGVWSHEELKRFRKRKIGRILLQTFEQIKPQRETEPEDT